MPTRPRRVRLYFTEAVAFFRRRVSDLLDNFAAAGVAAVAYFLAGKLGLKLAFVHASATAVWPPSGIALAAFLLFGRRIWPGIFLGAFLVNITTAGSLFTALGIATGNTLEGVLGAYLVSRFARGRRAFERSQDAMRFWVLAGMVSTVVSATLGVGSLCLTGFARWSGFGPIWLTWWLGDAVGGFVVSSLILLWSTRPRHGLEGTRVVEGALLLLAVALAGVMVFRDWFPHPYVCVPPLLWAAFRFGPRGTATATFLLTGIAIWGTVRGSGPFTMPDKNSSLLLLQAFTGVSAVTSMTVAALVSEHRRAVGALRGAHHELEQRVKERTEAYSIANEALRGEISERRRAEERFRRLLESAPDAMIIVNNQGNIELVNSRTETMFGHARQELVGQPVEILVPGQLRGKHTRHRDTYAAHPSLRPMGLGLSLRGVRKDGSEFPVEIALSPIETEEGVVICAAIRDTTEQQRLEEQLAGAARQRSEDLRDFAVSVQRVQEEERGRIARELHDDLGQRLTGLRMNVQVLEDGLPKNGHQPRARLRRIRRELDKMIGEVRTLSYNLHPPALDDFGLVVALDVLCKDFERAHGVATTFEARDSLSGFHDANVDIALYRIAQEALANVARHAQAAGVSVRLSGRHDEIVLSIDDDGCGFDMEAVRARRIKGRGLGLIGMRERSELLGGIFMVESGRGEGTRVEARLPLRPYTVHEPNQDTHRG